jgi:hypothetical protein
VAVDFDDRDPRRIGKPTQVNLNEHRSLRDSKDQPTRAAWPTRRTRSRSSPTQRPLTTRGAVLVVRVVEQLTYWPNLQARPVRIPDQLRFLSPSAERLGIVEEVGS